MIQQRAVFDNQPEKIPENLTVGSRGPIGADPLLDSRAPENRTCDYLSFFSNHPGLTQLVTTVPAAPDLNLLSLIYPKKKAK